MDYRMKVRIEVGPGFPVELSRLRESDARKAILKALFEQLSLDKWPADFIAKGTHGSMTACLFATKIHHFSEPSHSLPASDVEEIEFAVELEGPEEEAFRQAAPGQALGHPEVNDLTTVQPRLIGH